jgi:hypothetical protein
MMLVKSRTNGQNADRRKAVNGQYETSGGSAMLSPMMGLQFFLFTGGLAAGAVFLIFRPLRHWAPFVAFPPVLASLFAFAFSMCLALLTEQKLLSQAFAGAVFFGGFILSGLLGGCLGLFIAIKIRSSIAAKLLV